MFDLFPRSLYTLHRQGHESAGDHRDRLRVRLVRYAHQGLRRAGVMCGRVFNFVARCSSVCFGGREHVRLSAVWLFGYSATLFLLL